MSISETCSETRADREHRPIGQLQPVSRRREQRERGIAVILTAIMLLFILPAVGLAIDAGLLYVIRGRLTAACDAASLATARNLNLGATLAAQEAAAIIRGQAFFAANFPSGYLGTGTTTPVITLAQTNVSLLSVTTTATTTAPLYFMRIIGNNATVAGAYGKASRRAVNLMIVLDRSSSMAGTPCANMLTSAKDFVSKFSPDRDRLGMVTFGASSYLAYPATKDFQSGYTLSDAIDDITCTGWTNPGYAYYLAYQQLVTINEPLALNMIVFFTDGIPTAFTATFPIKTVPDNRYGDGATGTPANCQPNVTCSVAKSTCDDPQGRASTNLNWGTGPGAFTKTGVLKVTQPPSGTNLPPSTGDTSGLYIAQATSISTADPLISNRTNCQMSIGEDRIRRDIAYIPATDVNGIATTGYKALTTFTAAGHPYLNQIRPDMPLNVSYVGNNIADNAATLIRANTTLNVITYTLGLSADDPVLLKRMANDPLSSNFDNTKVDGLYVHADAPADLSAAFERIASEILRLAK